MLQQAMLPILLIIAHEGYHPVEYGLTRKALENAGLKVVVASDKVGLADATPSLGHREVCKEPQCTQVVKDFPQYASVQVAISLADVKPADYAGIFIIGGPGAMEFLDNATTYRLMQQAKEQGKPMGAICVSPRILAKAGVLQSKCATGWNGDHKLEGILEQNRVEYRNQPVIIDGTVITGDGPGSAAAFGEAIASFFRNEAKDEAEFNN